MLQCWQRHCVQSTRYVWRFVNLYKGNSDCTLYEYMALRSFSSITIAWILGSTDESLKHLYFMIERCLVLDQGTYRNAMGRDTGDTSNTLFSIAFLLDTYYNIAHYGFTRNSACLNDGSTNTYSCNCSENIMKTF